MTRIQKGITKTVWEELIRVLFKLKASRGIESIWPDADRLYLSIRNTGGVDLDLTIDTARIYCNGKPLSITSIEATSLAPGDTTIVTVDYSSL